jgi:hypothetical protein
LNAEPELHDEDGITNTVGISDNEGGADGNKLGCSLGRSVGFVDGIVLGTTEGSDEGSVEGTQEGRPDGSIDGWTDGEELGVFDFEGAPEGMDDDKLGSTDGAVVLGDEERLGDSLGLSLGFPEVKS